MILPTFVVIGAMKAGTVSLRHHLDEHPGVFLGRGRTFGEPNFFVAEDNWPRGRAWYESLFEGAGPAAAVGECSPCHTWAHVFRGVPERMAQPDTLRAVRVHGTACFSGSLSNQWTVRDFAPNEYLPRSARLAGYSGAAADLPREALQEILDAIAAGQLSFPVDRVYDGLEQVRQAHDDMEHDRATGKLVVRVRH
jgi:hypothetical protein